jgi:maleamate amidohydrolase
MRPWDRFLTDADKAILARGKWAGRAGKGRRPAVIAIDLQNYMVGERGKDDSAYPYSCGEIGWRAVDAGKRIVAAARQAAVPIIYTRFILDPSGADGGMFIRKVRKGEGDFAFLKGTHGAEIIPELAPEPGEIVIDKKKASAFFGTPLQVYLTDRGIDTLVVIGGSTSNCIRATVVDGSQSNYRVLVPEEAVFDRLQFSHAAALFDLDRTFADVVTVDDVVSYFADLAK